jgi:hypothetical protein
MLALFTLMGCRKRPSASSHASKYSPRIPLLHLLCCGLSKAEGGRDISCWSRLSFSEDEKGAARRMYLRWEMGKGKGARWAGEEFPLCNCGCTLIWQRACGKNMFVAHSLLLDSMDDYIPGRAKLVATFFTAVLI